MIVGVGIDTVEVKRFMHWHTKSHAQLSRLFSTTEINHCLSYKTKTSQRFAAAFAVREALFKTLWPVTVARIPFLALCKAVQLTSLPHPILNITWQRLPELTIPSAALRTHCSISHTATLATALVILEQKTP